MAYLKKSNVQEMREIGGIPPSIAGKPTSGILSDIYKDEIAEETLKS